MVAAVSTTPNPKVLPRAPAVNQKPKRAPLLPSAADNGPRKPKSKEITSRYLSSSSSTSTTSSSATSSSYSSNSSTPRRFPSPVVGRTVPATPAVNKRAQSVERRRPATTRSDNAGGEMSTSAKLLVNSSRSLSVSFQGESFALRTSKPKPAPAGNSLRNGTPERRTPTRDQMENTKPRWPVSSRQPNFMTRSVDFTVEKPKLAGSGSVVRDLKPKSENPVLEKTINNKIIIDSDPIVSDTESVSSGSTSGMRGGPRGIVVPARFWQETVNRLRRAPELVSPASKNNKMISGNSKLLNDGPTQSPRGLLSSPIRGAVRPASPSRRVMSSTSSPSRGMLSPARGRNGGVVASNSNLSCTPSFFSFAADARGAKAGKDRFVGAHTLRLLHNKHLQWRFVNARADAAMSIHRMTAEKSLYNAWVQTSKMWHSVKSKRIEIQLLRQNLKIHSILKKQMLYLDNWDHVDGDHSSSLSGAIVALESSTLRLPVGGGAKADLQNLKDAICSAVDVMQAMGSSICSLLMKVEHVNSLASELATTTANECSLLDQCKDLLSTLTVMQVKDCSLRTHILQVKACSLDHSIKPF